MEIDPFLGLLEKLQREDWPMVYMFKFIVPNDPQLIGQVTALFSDQNEMVFHESNKGAYLSITVKEMMMSAQDVVEIYRKTATIKGVITL
jgi:putative lipoic acid-binding regulatory protein